jgi:hypothetical protein
MSKKNGRRHFQGRPAAHKPAPQAQQVQVGTVNGRVAIRFGQAVRLIAFEPPQALQLAEMLAKHAAATVTPPPDCPAPATTEGVNLP